MLFDPTLKEQPRTTRHPEAFCWITYRGKAVPTMKVRVFNAVDEKVPLVIKLKGIEYVQETLVYEQVEDYQPKGGDLVFRRLKPEELEAVLDIRARRILNQVPKGQRRMPLAAVKRQHRGRLMHETVIVDIKHVEPLAE